MITTHVVQQIPSILVANKGLHNSKESDLNLLLCGINGNCFFFFLLIPFRIFVKMASLSSYVRMLECILFLHLCDFFLNHRNYSHIILKLTFKIIVIAFLCVT